MEDLSNDLCVPYREGYVVVKVTFLFHDLELIGDGEDSVFIWATEDECRMFEEYNAKPWAHEIGVMIGQQMPEFLNRVKEAVSFYAMDVFISKVRVYDPETDGDLVCEIGDLLYSEFDIMFDEGNDDDEVSFEKDH